VLCSITEQLLDGNCAFFYMLKEKVLSVHVKSHQLCLTCYSMDGSSPSASVHGILQARIPEWVPISFFKGIEPASLKSYALPGVFFTTSTTWEAPHKGS